MELTTPTPAELVPTTSPAVLAAIAELGDPNGSGARYLDASKSAATRRAYASDWRVFVSWVADAYGVDLDPPDDRGRVVLREPVHPAFLLRYLTDTATDRRHATLSRRMSAIRYHHHANGLVSPTDHPII